MLRHNYNKVVFGFLLSVLLMPVSVFAQGTWSTATPLPEGLAGRPAVATVDGKIYVIGGNIGSGVIVSTTYIYDPAAGTWTVGTSMPAARQNAAVAVVNGVIHVIGGAAAAGTPHTDHFVYDPATDTWGTRAPLPVAITQASAAAYGNSIYFVGGTYAGGGSGAGDGSEGISTNYLYDDTSDTWTTMAPMPTARALFGMAVVGLRIYAIGGHSLGSTVFSTNEVYNIVSNTWSTVASMPTVRNGMVAAAFNGEIYVIGGSPISNPGAEQMTLATNEQYDPLLNRWYIRTSMPTPRSGSGATVVNNRVYVIGGFNDGIPVPKNEVMTPYPIANPRADSITHNTATSLTLTGTDYDDPPLDLTFAIATQPLHGRLSGLNEKTGVVTYTPSANFQGADTFTFTVSNGTNASAAAPVTLNVAAGVPTANDKAVKVAHNTPTLITLTGTDPDSPPLKLTFAIKTQPAHGTLSGLNAATGAVTYTPGANKYGPDSFTFTVSNGTNKSTPATVTLTVAPGVPTANAQSVTVTENKPITITLTGSDTDNPPLPLTFAIVSSPARGTLGALNTKTGVVTYTPEANYHGDDSFTFTVSNGTNKSGPATVTLKVDSGG